MNTSKMFIQSYLNGIEANHDVSILFAVESGSRVWELPSQNPDYDVRYVYCFNRPQLNPQEVISGFTDDRLFDFQGWDLHKAILSCLKSPLTIINWLYSPEVYKKHTLSYHALRSFIPNNVKQEKVLKSLHGMCNAILRDDVEVLSTSSFKMPLKKLRYLCLFLLRGKHLKEQSLYSPISILKLKDLYAGWIYFLDDVLNLDQPDDYLVSLNRTQLNHLQALLRLLEPVDWSDAYSNFEVYKFKSFYTELVEGIRK